VTGFTVSAAQAARARRPNRGSVTLHHQDWLANTLPPATFDRAYAIESSEHMVDKGRFFSEAFRTLKPGGSLGIFAWLAPEAGKAWQHRHLLEPICREGRLPGMGTVADYRALAAAAGFELLEARDLSDRVSRTWCICLARGLAALASKPRYVRFLLNRTATDRIFAVTIIRIMIAYRVRAMQYWLFVFRRPAEAHGSV
jgi:tocopherol O-methyltransferase